MLYRVISSTGKIELQDATLGDCQNIVDHLVKTSDETDVYTWFIEEYLLNKVEYKSPYSEISELLKFGKESLALKIVEQRRYKNQLKTLLNALGIVNIEEILKGDIMVFEKLGNDISNSIFNNNSSQPNP